MINFKRQNYILPVGLTVLSGKTYIINGGFYDMVPDGTRFEDINVIESKERKISSAAAFPTFKANQLKKESVYVQSSKGNKEYRVDISKDPSGNIKAVTCTCPGYGFRRKCKHAATYL